MSTKKLAAIVVQNQRTDCVVRGITGVVSPGPDGIEVSMDSIQIEFLKTDYTSEQMYQSVMEILSKGETLEKQNPKFKNQMMACFSLRKAEKTAFFQSIQEHKGSFSGCMLYYTTVTTEKQVEFKAKYMTFEVDFSREYFRRDLKQRKITDLVSDHVCNSLAATNQALLDVGEKLQ